MNKRVNTTDNPMADPFSGFMVGQRWMMKSRKGRWTWGTGVASGNMERKKGLFGNWLRKWGEKDARKRARCSDEPGGHLTLRYWLVVGVCVGVCVSCIYWDLFHCTQRALYKLSKGLLVTGFLPTYVLRPPLLKILLMCSCIKSCFFFFYLFSLPSFPTPPPQKKPFYKNPSGVMTLVGIKYSKVPNVTLGSSFPPRNNSE